MIGAKRVFKLGFETQADAARWHNAILGALRALGPAELDPELDCQGADGMPVPEPSTPEESHHEQHDRQREQVTAGMAGVLVPACIAC